MRILLFLVALLLLPTPVHAAEAPELTEAAQAAEARKAARQAQTRRSQFLTRSGLSLAVGVASVGVGAALMSQGGLYGYEIYMVVLGVPPTVGGLTMVTLSLLAPRRELREFGQRPRSLLHLRPQRRPAVGGIVHNMVQLARVPIGVAPVLSREHQGLVVALRL